MFTQLDREIPAPQTPGETAAVAPRAPYRGPDRRRAATPWMWQCAAAMLDEIDYGMLLLDAEHHVLHANVAAQAELATLHPLQIEAGVLRTRTDADASALRDALAAAQRGLQRLVPLGRPPLARVAVAVLPLAALRGGSGQAGRMTALILGKREVCETLSVQWFARSHSLTRAEAAVLSDLCHGLTPAEAATARNVEIATVRTQIGAIRAKTGAASIRELVAMVARLPPMVGAIRPGAPTMPGWPRMLFQTPSH